MCEKVVIINAGKVVAEDMLENLAQDQTLEDVFLKTIAQEEPGAAETEETVEEAAE